MPSLPPVIALEIGSGTGVCAEEMLRAWDDAEGRVWIAPVVAMELES